MRSLHHLILMGSLLAFAQAEGAAGSQADVTALPTGKAIERTLSWGEAHTYEIALDAQQVLLAIIDQRGIDVIVSVFDPGGMKLADSHVRRVQRRARLHLLARKPR